MRCSQENNLSNTNLQIMKTTLKTVTFLLAFIFLSACSSQNAPMSAEVQSLLQKNEFTFTAERANPNNLDVINVLNSLPNGGASRILNLDPGYTIEITKDKIDVNLPYFGRMYNASMDPKKNSYRFTTKDFTIKKDEGKKGSTIYTIVANDHQNIRNINIEAFGNGRAYVSIDSNDRQPISYDGYITANTQ